MAEDLLKQRKIRGGHRAHVKQVATQIQAIMEEDFAKVNSYNLEELRNALVAKLVVVKAIDESIAKMMEDSEDVEESQFGQELTDACDYQLKYKKVVHLANLELNKIRPNVAAGTDSGATSETASGASGNTSESLHTSESLPVENSGQNVELTSATAVPTQQSNRASVRMKVPKLESLRAASSSGRSFGMRLRVRSTTTRAYRLSTSSLT